MKNFELIPFTNPDDLARSVASAWLDEIEAANRAGKMHSVALSGGRITQKFFTHTVEQARARKIPFANVHFFWADERCLPPTDPESNFKLANDLLFSPLNISLSQIHRLRGEDDPAAAVQAANAEILQVIEKKSDGLPVLDLVFLGMGEDGHIASLFPVLSAQFLDKNVPFLVVTNSPKPPPTRISMSYKIIFAAKDTWVLVSGAAKEKVFREALSASNLPPVPLALVIQKRHFTRVFSDIPAN
jgi:6-phosphogluconolactonase